MYAYIYIISNTLWLTPSGLDCVQCHFCLAGAGTRLQKWQCSRREAW